MPPGTSGRVPRLLDLFCCAGGASVGYARAGFDVVGVDIAPQPEYPFDFHRGDALDFLGTWGQDFDAVHASPPCQGYTALQAVNQNRYHPMLIPQTREALLRIGKPHIIENVPGAPIRHDLKLNGPTFGLGVILNRYFEMGLWKCPRIVLKPPAGRVRGWRHGQYFDGPYVAVYGKGGGKASVTEAQTAKGTPWISDWVALCEAVPPAYTEYIGTHLREWLLCG